VRLGGHRGGFLPFAFDVTGELDWQRDNELIVAVRDPTSRGRQQRGKQSSRPRLFFYTPVSGIWQTVWLEPVPECFVERLQLTPEIAPPRLRIEAVLAGGGRDARLRARARDGERTLAEASGPADRELVLDLPQAQLWSPENPKLYDLELSLDETGAEPDCVRSYFGLRHFGLARDARGTPRLSLNGEPRFQLGVLDQGWWPDGLYTAPTDAALRADVESIKRLGFDMVRKHVKVEPARWYHHCDRLGVVVWQDMPNGGRIGAGLVAATLAHQLGVRIRDDRGLGRFGRGTRAAREDYLRELRELVGTLASVPCIGGWVPFNEGWGQFDSRGVAEWLRQLDPTRPVEAASGWFDQGAGDLRGLHRYVGPDMPSPEADRAVGLSEFGGLGLRIPGHLFHPRRRVVYRMLESPEHLTRTYVGCVQRLAPLIEKGLSLSVYTQLTDVEIELNGLLTYDRAVFKADVERVARAHAELARVAAECQTRLRRAGKPGDQEEQECLST